MLVLAKESALPANSIGTSFLDLKLDVMLARNGCRSDRCLV